MTITLGGQKKPKWSKPYDPERRSITQVNMLHKCGEQFRRRYIEGEKIPPGFFAVRGSGAHSGIEHDLTTKVKTGSLAPLDEVLDAARDGVARKIDQEGLELSYEERLEGREKVVSRAVDDAVRASGLHHEKAAPSILPAAVEKRVDFTVKGVKMMAFLDVEEKDGAIRDTKVVSKKPQKGAADRSGQLAVYALAYRAETGKRSPRQQLDHLVLRSRDAEYLPSVREIPETEDVVTRRIWQADQQIRAGIFPPAPEGAWWCSARWCGYHSTCPYVGKGKSVTVPGK